MFFLKNWLWLYMNRRTLLSDMTALQCDQIKIAKFLFNLLKNDFSRRMNDFDIFTKSA